MIDHIAFIVEDPEATAAMLEKFGYHIVRKTAHHGCSVEVESDAQPGLVIEMNKVREQDSIGFNHVCMRISGQEECDRLQANGVSFDKAPHLSVESGRFITNHIDEDGIKWQVTF